jgi:hypothetical protein
MAKARRKMRRALMKKMRKGALTPGERRDLMELDREVNRANRQAAGIGGAGLAAALALASKTGALKEGKDALGDFLDERAGIREERKGQKAIEKEEKREARERAEDEADLSRRASAAARSEERAAERELKELRGAQGDYEEMLDDKARAEEKERYAEGRQDMREARQEMREERRDQRKADSGFDPYIEAVRNMDGSVAVGPANESQDIRERRQEALEQREEDRLDRRLERRGGYDPRTGEVVDSAKQRAADEEFDREFDESLPDAEVMEIARLYNEGRREEAERLASQVMTPDESAMRRFRGRTAVQALRGERSDLPMDASDYSGGFDTSGERPEFSSASLQRADGPRVENADGGTTPFLRAMRDRIRKKFR